MIHLRRSVLYVPADKPRALQKAVELPADVVILDLEDAVAPANKEEARAAAIAAAAPLAASGKEVVVRINGADTPWYHEDVTAVRRGGFSALVLPKVKTAIDVKRVALRAGMCVWPMIETAQAVLEAKAIAEAAASGGPAALVLGTNDLAAELGAAMPPPRHFITYSLQFVKLAAASAGIDVIDGVCNALDDEQRLRQECHQSRGMGYTGKTVIHPAQIELANRIFSPNKEAIAEAERVVEAMREAEAAGSAVATLDGRLVETLHARAAERVLAMAAVIAERNKAREAEVKRRKAEEEAAPAPSPADAPADRADLSDESADLEGEAVTLTALAEKGRKATSEPAAKFGEAEPETSLSDDASATTLAAVEVDEPRSDPSTDRAKAEAKQDAAEAGSEGLAPVDEQEDGDDDAGRPFSEASGAHHDTPSEDTRADAASDGGSSKPPDDADETAPVEDDAARDGSSTEDAPRGFLSPRLAGPSAHTDESDDTDAARQADQSAGEGEDDQDLAATEAEHGPSPSDRALAAIAQALSAAPLTEDDDPTFGADESPSFGHDKATRDRGAEERRDAPFSLAGFDEPETVENGVAEEKASFAVTASPEDGETDQKDGSEDGDSAPEEAPAKAPSRIEDDATASFAALFEAEEDEPETDRGPGRSPGQLGGVKGGRV